MKRHFFLLLAGLLALSISGIPTTSMAQAPNKVKCMVVDKSNNTPLPGVTVRLLENQNVPGQQLAFQSDQKGEFDLYIKGKQIKLILSYIGYIPDTLIVKADNKSSKVKLALKQNTSSLKDAVIVMNYQRSKQEKRPEPVAVAAYEMAAPKGYASSNIRIRLRGIGTLNNSNTSNDYNTEDYSAINENDFHAVTNQPLSTFSIDVDRASYSNIRRFLNAGEMPPADAVRVEEMINYFNYNYSNPTGKAPVAIHADMAVCPWNTGHQLVRIALKGKEVAKNNLPPSNIVFLIDVSGSMSDENKLPLVKQAFKTLVGQLRPVDKVAIVVYAGAAGQVLPSTSGDNKTTILDALDKLEAGGSTAGGAGIQLAYKTAAENLIRNGNNRVIIATDGDFNVGASSDGELQRLIEQEREKGIFLSVLGFGMGNYKDNKLETLADKGNGNYAYIDNFEEARRTFVTEFGGTLFTIAKDVKLQIEFNPRFVQSYRLVGYENRLLQNEDFNNDKKDAGDMGAGHTVTALYEIIPAGGKPDQPLAVDPLKYQLPAAATGNTSEVLTVKLRYKEPTDSTSQLISQVLNWKKQDIKDAPEDFRMATAVADFGLLLRNSAHKGDATWEQVLKLASNARGADEEGYRAEFIQLVKKAQLISNNHGTK